ncbi:MAG: DUF2997 domain-containing protein [Verrucomicrobiales bacterium]|nr:DUF2997 domain-containing protein [Verrucomicrobiales bacterium]
MKSNEHIDVWISPEGAITIDAVGFRGSSCEEATRFLEEGLGMVGRKQRTRDYYRKNRTQNSNPQNQET